MADPTVPSSYFDRTKRIEELLEKQGAFKPTPLTTQDILKQRAIVSGLPGLGPVDYDSQAKKAKEDAQRLFFLRMAERGFAAAGATPQPGERGNRGALSVLSRELFSPLAGDAGVLAGQLSKQEQAFQAAKRGDDARLSQAALTMGQQNISRDDAARTQRRSAARDLAKDKVSEAKNMERLVNGKWTPFSGFLAINEIDGIRYLSFGADGKQEAVPSSELRPKGQTAKYDAAVSFVARQGENGKWSLVPQAGGRGLVQLRQQTESTGSPWDIQAGAPRKLQPGEIVVKPADFGKYPGLEQGAASDAASGLESPLYNFVNSDGSTYTETNEDGEVVTPVFQVMSKGPNQAGFIRLGSQELISPEQFKRLNVGVRKVDTTTPTAVTPTGTEDPDFKANFIGFLSTLGSIQNTFGLGQAGIRFVPGNYIAEKGLDPTDPKFPFVRADGLALSEKDKKRIKFTVENGYLNISESLKAGTDRADLNEAFAQRILTPGAKELGLPAAPDSADRDPATIRSPTAIIASYKDTPQSFVANPIAAETLDRQPLPVGRALNSGVGRIRLASGLGVPFGVSTTSPAPFKEGDNVTTRRNEIDSLDGAGIQQRINAENLAKGTSLASTLNPVRTPRVTEQNAVVSEALDARQKSQREARETPGAQDAGRLLSESIRAVELLDRVDALSKTSGSLGFLKGPVTEFGIKRFNTDFSLALPGNKSPEEREASRELIAALPVLREIIARGLVKTAEGAGARVSNADLRGMQTTLTSMNESGDYSARKLQALRQFLIGSITHTLDRSHLVQVSDRTLEQAARLGVDLKAITPKDGFYSPWFNNGNYAVTRQPIPSYSQENQDAIRRQGLFSRILTPSGEGYNFIEIDRNGKPIRDNQNNLKISIFPASELTNPDYTALVKFNEAWLKKTYRLGR